MKADGKEKDTVQIVYDATKLLALKQYLGAKGFSVDHELEEALDRLYVRYVPLSVREFIDFRAGKSPEN